MNSADWSRAITWHRGQWKNSLEPIAAGADHALWMGSAVFDGARAFEGCIPDLDLHCQRLLRSAARVGMEPHLRWEQVHDLCLEGVEQFRPGTALYLRPMLMPVRGFLLNKPEECELSVTLTPLPMPSDQGFSACLTQLRRPHPDSAPTDAKAACLYPNSHRALREAMARGFDNALLLDHEGDVAEFAGANLLVVLDGELLSPLMRPSFLNGLTRQRLLGLLREQGVTVAEQALTPADLERASEILSTGNMGKVMRCHRYEQRLLPEGPWFRRLHGLYRQWALAQHPRRLTAGLEQAHG